MARSEIMVYVPIPTGEYPITVTDTELTESKYRNEDGTPKKQIKVTVDVDGTDGRQLSVWRNWPPYKKSQIVKDAKAFGLECEDSLDTDDLIGLKAIAVIIAYTKDDGEEANRIEEIKAKKGGAPVPKPAAAQPHPPSPTPAVADDPFHEDEEEAEVVNVPSDKDDVALMHTVATRIGLTPDGFGVWRKEKYGVDKTKFLHKRAIAEGIAVLENELTASDVKAYNDAAAEATS